MSAEKTPEAHELMSRLSYVYGVVQAALEVPLPSVSNLDMGQDRRQLVLIRRALAPFFEPSVHITTGEPDA